MVLYGSLVWLFDIAGLRSVVALRLRRGQPAPAE
jgi:hypothetical protein